MYSLSSYRLYLQIISALCSPIAIFWAELPKKIASVCSHHTRERASKVSTCGTSQPPRHLHMPCFRFHPSPLLGQRTICTTLNSRNVKAREIFLLREVKLRNQSSTKSTTSSSQVVRQLFVRRMISSANGPYLWILFTGSDRFIDLANTKQEEQLVLSWPIALLSLDTSPCWSSKQGLVPNKFWHTNRLAATNSSKAA